MALQVAIRFKVTWFCWYRSAHEGALSQYEQQTTATKQEWSQRQQWKNNIGIARTICDEYYLTHQNRIPTQVKSGTNLLLIASLMLCWVSLSSS